MSQMYEVKISAMGEVRDAEGNLVSSEPVEATMQVTEEQAEALREGNAS
jgi:Fe2+ transport system protein FeoA